MHDNSIQGKKVLAATEGYVKKALANAEAGHDWFHISRVYKNALQIAKEEPCDLFIVGLGALLHDIADAKFHNGNEELGPKLAAEFLTEQNVSQEIVHHVCNIIKAISYKNSLETDGVAFHSKELEIVRDADRLDAIGAIGIARTFHYGGFRNRKIYDPEIPPLQKHTKASYKNSTAPTINHFYEKLLLLKSQMHTQKGKTMAAERHQFMEQFLDQFYSEWNADDHP